MALVSVFLAPVAYALAVFRDESGRWLNRQERRPRTEYIVVHYDSIFRPTSLDEIQHQHRDVNGWESGFAYHYYLYGGKVYKTRNEDSSSPHAYGYNDNSVAVCIHAESGELDRINLRLLVSYLRLKYNISKERVVGHGELPGNHTECPGFPMDSLRSMLY